MEEANTDQAEVRLNFSFHILVFTVYLNPIIVVVVLFAVLSRWIFAQQLITA